MQGYSETRAKMPAGVSKGTVVLNQHVGIYGMQGHAGI